MNTYAYVEGNPLSYVDPTGELAFIPVVIGIGAGYAFDYLLEQYKKEHCTCKDTPAGGAGNGAAGGAVGGTGPFAIMMCIIQFKRSAQIAAQERV